MRFATDFRLLPYRVLWAVEGAWYALRLRWYTLNKGMWIAGLAVALALGLFWMLAQASLAYRVDRRNLTCLARNVYFETRGEPATGQQAVAEVTMNRMASGLYPPTVCGVVYQQRWDAQRKRMVGAFSWTEFDNLPPPRGPQWQRAWQVADAVYYSRQAPVLDEDALFYHATYVKPQWARGKQPIAKIGRHVFYR